MTRGRIGIVQAALPLGRVALLAASLIVATKARAIGQQRFIEFGQSSGAFTLSHEGQTTTLYVAPQDWPGVEHAAEDLRDDIERVTGRKPDISHDLNDLKGNVVVLGAIGKSDLIDRLVTEHKLDTSVVAGKWESTVIQTVKDPTKGLKQALVIAGSDKRGAIFGVYDISEQIGVSPWYWWADVPAAHRTNLYVKPGCWVQGEPAVKYRGIFLNDESPDLSNWVYEKFGDYNHKFYIHIFELLLRLRANYLWPAMWNNSFNLDDPLNEKLADEYGIVMGTSHVEPMMRADKEWGKAGYSANAWRFDTHSKDLLDFWAQGLDRSKPYEDIVTIAMRGKIDTPMSETANIGLLEQIVEAQRKLIAEHLNPDVTKVPQLWALYKEVQEYYDKGMRVPDDVTLLWCDDNWGDIRRLPTEAERARTGGAGVYYHFDYVGGPRNYKWTNTNPIPKIWEQMNNAYDAGDNRIWIVNVGSLKPKEFPTEFFLSFAWDPKAWPKEKLHEFTLDWARREFPPKFAPKIADIVEKYAKYNGRRKPELLDATTYSVVNYNEADHVAADFRKITDDAEEIYRLLPRAYRDAFEELVLFPTRSCNVVNQLYIATAKNRLYAKQGRVSANLWAQRAQHYYQEDADLANHFNHELADGKWDHFQDQTHIGYTYWQQPDRQSMPRLSTVTPTSEPAIGVAVQGREDSWPELSQMTALPEFDEQGAEEHWIDVYQRGTSPASFTVHTDRPWIKVTDTVIDQDHRLQISIDRSKLAGRAQSGTIVVTGPDRKSAVVLVAASSNLIPSSSARSFRESDDVISIEAQHFDRRTKAAGLDWQTIPDYGRTLSGVTVGPITAPSVEPGKGPCLEYRIFAADSGPVDVIGIFGPSLSTMPNRGLRCAISIDNGQPQVINIDPGYLSPAWEKAVSDSVQTTHTKFSLDKPGLHTLKVWMVDPGVVLEKLILNFGGLRPSYLGPPESRRQ